jgi:hypothetical protein
MPQTKLSMLDDDVSFGARRLINKKVQLRYWFGSLFEAFVPRQISSHAAAGWEV